MRFVFSLALVAALPSSVAGQDTEWHRYTLEDLAGVYPSVSVAESCAGVDAATLQAEASTALEGSTVPVLTEAAMLEAPGLPELNVSLECSSSGADWTGYSVSLRVEQSAQLIRDPQITLAEAVTWWTTTTGVSNAAGLSSAVSQTMGESLDAFAAAFEAANTAEEGSN